MAWFRRTKAGILTDNSDKNDVPDGQWVKCPGCSEILNRRELDDNHRVCPRCQHHFRMNSLGYFNLLFDEAQYTLFDGQLYATDPLHFTDTKSYESRLAAAYKRSDLNDAARAALGPIGGHQVSVAAMDFSFIGGSMGSVVGEILSRAIRRAYTEEVPLIIFSQSGGARMMEGALSLMQMAKTSAHLTRLAEKGLPYFSILTHPTTGGVTASFAMLGDFNIAEPQALIGFAGPRVIRETIGQDLPTGFQRSEFLQEHGFIDFIEPRGGLRDRIILLLNHLADGA